jgi:hypothetical protein
MRSGVVRESVVQIRPHVVARVGARGSRWPTPRANKPGGFSSPAFSQTLEQAVMEIPRGYRAHHAGNRLNPEWVGWLMGFPFGWTA